MAHIHAIYDYKGWDLESGAYNQTIKGIATNSVAGHEALEKPKIFRFKWVSGHVVMHYKIMSYLNWMPAEKNEDGTIKYCMNEVTGEASHLHHWCCCWSAH